MPFPRDDLVSIRLGKVLNSDVIRIDVEIGHIGGPLKKKSPNEKEEGEEEEEERGWWCGSGGGSEGDGRGEAGGKDLVYVDLSEFPHWQHRNLNANITSNGLYMKKNSQKPPTKKKVKNGDLGVRPICHFR